MSSPIVVTSLQRVSFLIGYLFCAVACSGSNVVVTEVLNHHTCRLQSEGVKQINHATLPRLRGARLLPEPGQTEPDLQGDPTRILIVVSRGSQPTPGYALSLTSASQQDSVIALQYDWSQPDPDKILAQIMTHPCSVVELDDPATGSLSGLSVEAWVGVEELGTIELH
jgi:hypothetical protein